MMNDDDNGDDNVVDTVGTYYNSDDYVEYADDGDGYGHGYGHGYGYGYVYGYVYGYAYCYVYAYVYG